MDKRNVAACRKCRMSAGIKLETMGMQIDTLTDEQVAYATDYSAGT